MRMTAIVLGVWVACAAGPAAAQQAQTDPMLDAARINVRLGLEYMRQGQLAIARDKIERALQQNPRDVGVQVGAGMLYEKMQDPRKAERHYRQALRIESDNPEAQNSFGAFLCRSGEAKRGEEMFLAAARNPLYRTPEVAYTNAGVCARGAGRLEQADQYLRSALAQRAVYSEALMQLAGVSFERRNLLQARAFLQRYLAVAPAAPEAYLLGYQVEKALADDAAADEFGLRLRTQFPDSPEARILVELRRQGPG